MEAGSPRLQPGPGAEPLALRVEEHASLETLPASAQALTGGDVFSSQAWYRTVIAAGLPAASRPVLLSFWRAEAAVALVPMLVSAGAATSLTTPYTCLWQPLLAPGADTAAVWRGFAAWCRRWPEVRLEALDAAMAQGIAAAVAGQRLVPLRFEHFGNWHAAAADGWAGYFAQRPGQVREAVRRRGKRLMAQGGTWRVLRHPAEIEQGIAAYEAVYARSWKEPEPFPAFNATLMRECAADGSLRLGLLEQGGAVLAAQIWLVRDGWAAVLKLAHDEAARAHSPGTVLTALMIEHLIEQDGVRALDFGRGDDAYKASWTGQRRQRMGLVLANPLTLRGLAAVARHEAGRLRKRLASDLLFLKKKKQKDF